MCQVDKKIETAAAVENTTNTNALLVIFDKLECCWQRNSLIVSFFVSVLLCCIIYLTAVIIKEKNFEASQKRIIEVYERHTVKSGKKSQQSFFLFQQPQENQEKFQEEIKSLLELQQSYIQDNFGSFEIWAGILTIVFLVFSFFSLQKSEQMEQQSREALKKINENMENSETKMTEFENGKSKLFSTFETDKNDKLGKFESKSDLSLTSFSGSSTKALEDFEKDSKKLKDKFEKDSNSLLNGFLDRMNEVKAEILEQGKQMILSESERTATDFQQRATNLWKYMIENDYKNQLSYSQESLKKDYEKYRMRLLNLIDNPDEHDIIQTQEHIADPEIDTEEAPINDEED